MTDHAHARTGDRGHRHPPHPRAWVVGVILAIALVLVGCSTSSDDSDQSPGDRSGDTTDTGETTDNDNENEDDTEDEDREGIDGDFGEVAVTITAADGETCELCLLLADTPTLRSQGLMRVTDPELGGYDGMLFDHGEASMGAYWMQDTLMPLSIAYWDAEGEFVSSVDMEPCVTDQPGSCPTYPAEGPFQFALEVTQGGLEEVLAVEGSTLTVDGTACPATAT